MVATLLALMLAPPASAQTYQPLQDALQRRGYAFRQHLEEVGWTQRKLTVVDLDERQRAAFARAGVAGLKRALDEDGRWSFPAMDILQPLPARGDVVLAESGIARAVIVAPAAGKLRQLAEEFSRTVASQSGVKLRLIDDAHAELALLQSQDVVLFGGSHENRFATDLALRYQGGFVDGVVPGPDGWVVTTHAGLDASGHTVIQVAASAASHADVLACLQGALRTADRRVLLRATHRVMPGKDMRAHFPPWETWAARLAGLRPGSPADDPVKWEPKALAERIVPTTTRGDRAPAAYNTAPVDTAIQCAQYYQRSADPRALELFRELLFRVVDFYLKRPDGAYYPPDLDFRIGRALVYYSRLEHEPIFTEEDRLILANFLLSCTRSIYEYTIKMWPLKPEVATIHNHESFAARSLMYAVEYFDRYRVPYTAEWRKRVDDVFAREVWNRYKQRENANSYETYAYDHAAAYSAFAGRRLDWFDREALRLAARRHMIATDNFFRAVDYGDTGLTMRPGTVDRLAVLFTSQHEDSALAWFAHACFERSRAYLPGPLDGFTDLRRPYHGSPPQTGQWELLPLDPKFAATEAPGFPTQYTFDKLAFRTGWQDDGHYLLFEGVGNLKVSHSHANVNGIVRLNHLGRHLLVSNGYGRTVAEPSSFGGRVRGPEDHNNLVLLRGGKIVRELPVCSALLQRGQSGDLAYATGAVLGYSGLDWYRTVLILADRFVLAIDRIRRGASGPEAGHVEWNCPGDVAVRGNEFRVEQQGVYLDLLSASGWPAAQGVADRSNDWKSTLESGAYPYARWPIRKLRHQMPPPAADHPMHLAVLLAATRAAEPRYRISEPQRGFIRVESLDRQLPPLDITDGDLHVRGDGAALEIRFAPVPALPLALQAWAAK